MAAGQDWFGSKYETPESEGHVGLDQTAALDTARAAGIDVIRVFEIPGAGRYTLDFNERRLDLLVEDHTVIAAAFF